jgi:phage baseplate assembly protein W
MSVSLKVVNGDLSITAGRFDLVQGTDKLKQDLTLWLTERYRDDRFHPTYGSILDGYIGGVINPSETVVRVQSETLRVLSNYEQIQIARFKESPSKFQPSELLKSVNGVDVSLSYDKVIVLVRITTAARTTTSISVGFGV